MNRKASLLFIFATVSIDAIGLGIIMPVMPEVLRRFISDATTLSQVFGIFIALYALMQFLSSPLLGRLSDRFGRRPILLISLLGAAIDYLFMAFSPSLPLLFVGRIISGISGASFTVASAYIADISNDENRSRNFGVIGAGFGLGFIAGPAIGGLLATYGTHYAFLAAAGFNFLNFLFGLWILPESLLPKDRRSFEIRHLNPFRSLKTVLSIPAIQSLIIVYVLLQLAGHTHFSLWTLYTEHRYGWNASQVGISLTVVGLLSALSQGVLTGHLVKKFGEKIVLTIGCFGEAVSYLLFGWAPTGTILYGVLIFASIFWAAQPALQSLVSREVPPQMQGELQGSLMSLGSLTAVINPVVMTSLFSFSSDRVSSYYLPGAPYYLGSMLLFIAGALAVRQLRQKPPLPTSAVEPQLT